MRKFVSFFVDRSLLVNLITVLVIIFGVVGAFNMTRAFIPPITPNLIVATATLPGASAADMERFVTFRIEEALSGLDENALLVAEAKGE